MPFYKLVDDPSALELPPGVHISYLYVVASLEIAIKDRVGSGLALRLHSYPRDTSSEGYWAPPNLQYRLDHEAPPEVKKMVEDLHEYVKSNHEVMAKNLVNLAESFGLRGAKVERVEGDPITELKPSINNPGVNSAFCTVRFALTDLKERSETNLVDRDGRHGFIFFPLTGPATERIRNYQDLGGTGLVSRHYLGKPVISGLQHLLDYPIVVSGILGRAINVEEVKTHRKQNGLIVAADIAGYGKVLVSEYLGLMSNPTSERSEYQRRVLSALESAFTAAGTTQVQTAGDGFIAAYPVGDLASDFDEVFINVVENWTKTVNLVSGEINSALATANQKGRLGTRIGISAGEYEWGRINGLESFAPAFNGPAIVRTARLEQGLNNAMRKGFLKQNGKKKVQIRSDEHYLAFDPEGSRKLSLSAISRLDNLGWRSLGEFALSAKEFQGNDIQVFSWSIAQKTASFE